MEEIKKMTRKERKAEAERLAKKLSELHEKYPRIVLSRIKIARITKPSWSKIYGALSIVWAVVSYLFVIANQDSEFISGGVLRNVVKYGWIIPAVIAIVYLWIYYKVWSNDLIEMNYSRDSVLSLREDLRRGEEIIEEENKRTAEAEEAAEIIGYARRAIEIDLVGSLEIDMKRRKADVMMLGKDLTYALTREDAYRLVLDVIKNMEDWEKIQKFIAAQKQRG